MRRAARPASARLSARSARRITDMWPFTVRRPMPSSAAMALLEQPSATRPSTSYWRSVRLSGPVPRRAPGAVRSMKVGLAGGRARSLPRTQTLPIIASLNAAARMSVDAVFGISALIPALSMRAEATPPAQSLNASSSNCGWSLRSVLISSALNSASLNHAASNAGALLIAARAVAASTASINTHVASICKVTRLSPSRTRACGSASNTRMRAAQCW